jgi:hypothetical protein
MQREDGLPNWLDETRISSAPLIEQYFASLQWSVSALKASETVSGTLSEYFVAAIIMVIGAALYANIISSGKLCCVYVRVTLINTDVLFL